MCMCPLQVAMSLMVNPPKEGDDSYAEYKEERASIIASLRERAQIMTDGFNSCEGASRIPWGCM